METSETSASNVETTSGSSDVSVIFSLSNSFYGINSYYVKEMVQVDSITASVDTPEYVTGVTNLRGSIIPIVDLRTRFGMKSLQNEASEFISMLSECETGHVKWINELETCIRENREFTLARNPHKCKFGVWYDNYKSKDIQIASFLKKFDQPHQAIHAIADEAISLETAGKIEEANRLINDTKNTTLAVMLKLFKGLKALVEERVQSVVMVLNVNDKHFGLNVDDVNSVSQILPDQKEELNSYIKNGVSEKFISESAKVKVDSVEQIVMMLDPSKLY